MADWSQLVVAVRSIDCYSAVVGIDDTANFGYYVAGEMKTRHFCHRCCVDWYGVVAAAASGYTSIVEGGTAVVMVKTHSGRKYNLNYSHYSPADCFHSPAQALPGQYSSHPADTAPSAELQGQYIAQCKRSVHYDDYY